MKKYILIALSVMIIASFYADTKITLAVLDLDAKGVTKEFTSTVTEYLRSSIYQTQKFTLVSSESMETILAEQRFQLSGCVSDECIVEVGKLLGVQKILTGSIGKIGNLWMLSFKIIDVGSAKLEYAFSKECGSEEETISVVQEFTKQIAGSGNLGMDIGNISTEDITRLKFPLNNGVIILNVRKGLSADGAGLIKDDIIVEMNDKTVLNIGELSARLNNLSPGAEVKLKVFRSGEFRTFLLTARYAMLPETRDIPGRRETIKQPEQPVIPVSPPKKELIMIDLYSSGGSGSGRLRFERSDPQISQSELGISGTFPATFDSIEWRHLKTKQGFNIGLKVEVLSAKPSSSIFLGWGMDLGWTSLKVIPQTTEFYVNDTGPGTFTFSVDDYFSFGCFYMIFNLIITNNFGTKFLYSSFNIGLGLSYNFWKTPYAKGYTEGDIFSAPSSGKALGLPINLSLPFRVKILEGLFIFFEMNGSVNYFTFTRNIKNEKDVYDGSVVSFRFGISSGGEFLPEK